MDYNVVMPKLSDSMSEGKLVEWKVKVGDKVSSGDVIADIESDKAVVEVQTFKDGIVKELKIKKNEEAKTGSVIAVIDAREKEPVKPKHQSNEDDVVDILFGDSKRNIDDNTKTRYFTPKAMSLISEYGLNFEDFTLDHKIGSEEILKFIKEKNVSKTVKLTTNQKSIIKTTVKSLQKPVFHINEEVEITKKEGIKITANIIKALSNSMQKFPLSRAVLKDDLLKIYSVNNISVTLNKEDLLYTVVIKNVENLSLKEISDWLINIKTKKLSSEDLNGSTFGISNLGMFRIESFDAILNADNVAIAAFGEIREGRARATFTFDHRIMNGTIAAKFVMDFKEELKNV